MKDGGPAFPKYFKEDGYKGMTLLDYFAGQALIGILAFPGSLEGKETKRSGTVADTSYAFADAMLAERERRSTP